MKITYTPADTKPSKTHLIPSVLVTTLISLWLASVGLMWDPSILRHGIQLQSIRSK